MKIELNERRLDVFLALKEGKTGEEIADIFGISRVAVWKFVKKLESLGYEVSREKGYRIVKSPDPSPYDMALAVKSIKDMENFYYFNEIDSTNRFAKKVDRSVVFAEKQNEGRGRLGRRWESEKGGLYMSISLNLSLPVTEIPKITLMSGLAVCKALEKYNPRIKWPNDVMINGKKVSGILCEFIGEELSSKTIVGIGINVRNQIPEGLKDKAINLEEVDKNVTITETFKLLCTEFGRLYESFPENWEEILEEWKRRSDTLGRFVRIKIGNRSFSGKAVDIDSDGGLVVETANGREKIISGECFYTNY